MGITIAIDGFAACGKSTLAKSLAKRMNYRFIDSGAMYRAVTLFFLRNDIDIQNLDKVAQALEKIKIEFQNISGNNCTILNGENVESDIRELEVSNMVSPVSAISIVRKFLVEQQKEMGKDGSIVMDGRDIGTVVFPNAELKLFLTADIDVRVRRRILETQNYSFEQIKNNLTERDLIDSTRADSPLKCAQDAIIIDNSEIDMSEQFRIVLNLIEDKFSIKTEV
jgi:cytidylate kinase